MQYCSPHRSGGRCNAVQALWYGELEHQSGALQFVVVLGLGVDLYEVGQIAVIVH
jgi:hypothetical protein